MPINEVGILAASVGLGALGTLVGFGAGAFLVPVLSAFFGVPLKLAIAASALSVIVNSTSGASVYLRRHLTNLRLGMLLEISTTLGSVVGGFLVVVATPNALRLTLAGVLLVMSALTFLTRKVRDPMEGGADPLGLGQRFVDSATGYTVEYVPRRLGGGMALSSIAGVMSGLLGIGGGPIKVALMNAWMRIPIKAASATSIYMVGITVAASSLIYYRHGLIDPAVVVPTCLGVFVGSQMGAWLHGRVRGAVIQWLLILVLLYLAVTLFFQALGIALPGTVVV